MTSTVEVQVQFPTCFLRIFVFAAVPRAKGVSPYPEANPVSSMFHRFSGKMSRISGTCKRGNQALITSTDAPLTLLASVELHLRISAVEGLQPVFSDCRGLFWSSHEASSKSPDLCVRRRQAQRALNTNPVCQNLLLCGRKLLAMFKRETALLRAVRSMHESRTRYSELPRRLS